MKKFYNQSSALTVPYVYVPSNEQTAWLAIVYTAACMHGPISQQARETFCRLIATKELFRGHELLDYFNEVREVQEELEPKEIIRHAALSGAHSLRCAVGSRNRRHRSRLRQSVPG